MQQQAIESEIQSLLSGGALTGSTENSLEMTLFVAIGLFLGWTLTKIHGSYYEKNEPQDTSLTRSLMILTPIMTLVFFIIQKSLVLSLGLIGSLSFIRYRTSIKRAEDITFILSSIGIGLSLSIQNLYLAFAIPSILAVVTAHKKYDKYRKITYQDALLTFRTRKSPSETQIVHSLQQAGFNAEILRSRAHDGLNSFIIKLNEVKKSDGLNQQILPILKEFDNFGDVHLVFSQALVEV